MTTENETQIFEEDGWTFTKEHSSKEYVEARRLMGLTTTNLDELQKYVGYAYLHCPKEHAVIWQALIEEIEKRSFYAITGIIT